MNPVDAQITGQQRLRDRVVELIAALWAGLGGYDEQQVPGFVDQAAALVFAGQRASVALTDAYIARAIDRPPVGVDAQAVIQQLRAGTPATTVYRRPFVTVWTDLSNHVPYEQAVNAGLERATGTAAMDMQLAHIGAYQAVQDAQPAIKGFRRKADAGACAFCRLVDGAFVKRADAAPLHNRCGCGLEPILTPVTPSPLPDGVAVHDHGELGPVLGDPAHDFTRL